MMEGKPNVILEKSLAFALEIIAYAEKLEAGRRYVIANQLLKSGTSIGANVREAQHAESKRDFLHKLKIAMKEVEETEYWLILCERAENYPDPVGLPNQLGDIKRILSKIIGSTVRNHPETSRH